MNSHPPLPDDLPLLTEVVGEATGGFPLLTEVVGEATGDFPLPTEVVNEATGVLPFPPGIVEETPAMPAPDAPDLSPQLLQDLQVHLENVFARKLRQHLADAQQQAIEQALAELKSELPQLIRDALATPHDPA